MDNIIEGKKYKNKLCMQCRSITSFSSEILGVPMYTSNNFVTENEVSKSASDNFS